jgi:bleomycin hydrolase
MRALSFPVSHFDKGAMLDYGHSAMNHAMVITGVNLVKEVPNRWKIENSWGGDNGTNGYYVMSQDWFDTFVYQAVILKKYLNERRKSRDRPRADPSPSVGSDGHLSRLNSAVNET